MANKPPKLKSAALDLDNQLLEVTLENDEVVSANILFTFNENGDQFIFYEIANVVYAAKLQVDNTLLAINDDEWKIAEQIFEQWINEPDDEMDEEED